MEERRPVNPLYKVFRIFTYVGNYTVKMRIFTYDSLISLLTISTYMFLHVVL